MIRVTKSDNIPQSLLTKKSNSSEDVKRQLRKDHKSICYLCDRLKDTDFDIEHFMSKGNYPQLASEWQNLFFSCRYCNQKKGARYDGILNPLNNNIEELLVQKIDIKNNKALFYSSGSLSSEIEKTIDLLGKIYNGKKGGLKSDTEEAFFKSILGKYNSFIKLVAEYVNSPSDELKIAIEEELSLGKEILGLKYWVVMENDVLKEIFEGYIKWNRI